MEGIAGESVSTGTSLVGKAGEPHFQLIQAASTPKGSQRTSLCLYIMMKLVGRRSGWSTFSPCLIVHWSFSMVTKISPTIASTFVLPESRHATVAMSS